MAEEILNIQWLEYKTNLQPSLQEFRDNEDIFDVTLACKDGRSQAHRVVLGSCSPFFLNLLRSYSHPHPLTNKLNNQMKDIEIVLSESSNDPRILMTSEIEDMNIFDPVMNAIKNEPIEAGYCAVKSEILNFKDSDLTNNNKLMDEYYQTVQTLIEKHPIRGHRCTKCGYSNVRRDCVLKHAQKHVFTTGLPCKFCDMKFNSENYLKRHVLKKHKKSVLIQVIT
jgi:hypothetical protein